MTDAPPPEMDTITSTDGTTIAVERTGSGPPMVLVHGTTLDRASWNLVRPRFEDQFAVYAMDRRGCGESGDADTYELEREFEDVLAVIESIDSPVTLVGHSFGALCAIEAALRTETLRELVLYEPPIDQGLGTESVLAEMKTLLDDGANEQALELFLREFAGATSADIDEARSEPDWQERVDAAHTAYREPHEIEQHEFDTARYSDISTPTLLVSGTESPPHLQAKIDELADILPNSRVAILEGEGHGGIGTAPDRFVDEVLAFTRRSD